MRTFPPGVTSIKKALPTGGWSYEFRHVTLGELGHVEIIGTEDNHSRTNFFVVPGDAADPVWQERFTTMHRISEIISEALGTGSTPLPDLKTAMAEMRLYTLFSDAPTSIEMEHLANTLSEAEYTSLLSGIQKALVSATQHDAISIQQRLHDLQRFRSSRKKSHTKGKQKT
jgi:hypothetical protein